ncbi:MULTISPECIES: hypothetical protein [unclassified Lysobacter]|uniref:hypothetical protein n=1 Tax=unclassified Lysobacter TaxID=2635362 RepID=UPI001C24BF14|nr:hypothetical protein [Lysobacter sp. MMG2]MBU8977730.1 hypothetical protein [Lysobacter sp. MMG2]
MRMSPLLLLMFTAPALAAGPGAAKPEISRGPVAPQAQNAVHTLRQIPEACARLEGMFTGQAAEPYTFAVVRISPQCQPRARFVDAAKARPEQNGWVLNDVIRVPNAACPSQQAVVHVWRKPVDKTPKLDGQGQARIYLKEQSDKAKAGQLDAVPMYAAQMDVEGTSCGR